MYPPWNKSISRYKIAQRVFWSDSYLPLSYIKYKFVRGTVKGEPQKLITSQYQFPKFRHCSAPHSLITLKVQEFSWEYLDLKLISFSPSSHQHCCSCHIIFLMMVEKAVVLFFTLALHLAQATTCQGDNCTTGDFLSFSLFIFISCPSHHLPRSQLQNWWFFIWSHACASIRKHSSN